MKLDEEFISRASQNLRVIRNPDGAIVGRACITAPHIGLGVLTVGGLFASEMIGIGGILVGAPERAARDLARPSVAIEALVAWATEQSDLVPQLHTDIELQIQCSQMIRELGGDTKNLPIAFWKGNVVSYDDIVNDQNLPDEVIFVDPIFLDQFKHLAGFSLLPNVFIVEFDAYQGILASHSWGSSWPEDLFNTWGYGFHSIENNLGGVVIEALAKVWNVTAREILQASKYIESHEEKVVFGYINGEEIKAWGLTIRRPS